MRTRIAFEMPSSAEKLKLGDEYKLRALAAENRVLQYGGVQDVDGNSYYGRWYMELSPKDGDFSRVASGACPLMFGHREHHLGVVTTAEIVQGELHLGVRWTSLPAEGGTAAQAFARELWRGVAERTRNAYSIGADRTALKRTGKINGVPVFKVLSWVLMEVSLVDVGAVGSATRLSAQDAEMEEQQMVENSTDGLSAVRLELQASFDAQLANAKAELQAGFEAQLARVRAEAAVRELQLRGVVKAGDEIPAKLAPALQAVPELEQFFQVSPQNAGSAAARKPLQQPAAGKRSVTFSAEEIVAQARKDNADPYSLIDDE